MGSQGEGFGRRIVAHRKAAGAESYLTENFTAECRVGPSSCDIAAEDWKWLGFKKGSPFSDDTAIDLAIPLIMIASVDNECR